MIILSQDTFYRTSMLCKIKHITFHYSQIFLDFYLCMNFWNIFGVYTPVTCLYFIHKTAVVYWLHKCFTKGTFSPYYYSITVVNFNTTISTECLFNKFSGPSILLLPLFIFIFHGMSTFISSSYIPPFFFLYEAHTQWKPRCLQKTKLIRECIAIKGNICFMLTWACFYEITSHIVDF